MSPVASVSHVLEAALKHGVPVLEKGDITGERIFIPQEAMDIYHNAKEVATVCHCFC